ncbi:hypothetical protein D3C81_2261310 [compost metagenome]
MLAHEALYAAWSVQQVQGDGVGHDLAHQVHDIMLERLLDMFVLIDESDPL